jgi:hypothetical protein
MPVASPWMPVSVVGTNRTIVDRVQVAHGTLDFEPTPGAARPSRRLAEIIIDFRAVSEYSLKRQQNWTFMTDLGKCLMACVPAPPPVAQPTPLYQDPSVDQRPPFTDYRRKGRTYRFFTGEPLYPFGYGLSYTTFACRNLSLPARAKAETAKVAQKVRNTASGTGEELVHLYRRASGGVGPAPLRWLAEFERAGERPADCTAGNVRDPGGRKAAWRIGSGDHSSGYREGANRRRAEGVELSPQGGDQ